MKKNNIVNDPSQAVFAGINAREKYINPENHPFTPLIEITDDSLNPFQNDSLRIFAKDLRLPPLGQIKSGTAYEMHRNAMIRGELRDSDILYESSSGNTGAALTVLSKGNVVIYVKDH